MCCSLSCRFSRQALFAVVLVASALSSAVAQAPPAVKSAKLPPQTSGQDSAQLWDAAIGLDKEGKPAAAITAAEKSIATLRAAKKESSVEIAEKLAWLADRYIRQDNIAAAQKARSEILGIYSRLPGVERWKVVSAGVDVADVKRLEKLSPEYRGRLLVAADRQREAERLAAQSKYGEALAAAYDALATRGGVLGRLHRDYSATLTVLGSIRALQGDYTQAEPAFREAAEIVRGTYGPDHPATAAASSQLAAVYQR